MNSQRGVWVGLVLGMLGGLAVFFAMLAAEVSAASSDASGEGCGTGLLGFIVFGPVIALVLIAFGGAIGCSLGLLVGGIYGSAEQGTVERPRGRLVLPPCTKCGRTATIAERNISSCCPGCGEILPPAYRKPEQVEL
jgi:hypothetical protein